MLRGALEALEAAVAKEDAKVAAKKGITSASLPAPDTSDSEAPTAQEKPKRPLNSWIIFTQRVDALLKANNCSSKATENKQFASSLKLKKVYSDWTEEQILAEKAIWVKPEKLEMPKNDVYNEIDKIMDEITSDSGSVPDTEKPKKKRGRPSKKTE